MELEDLRLRCFAEKKKAVTQEYVILMKLLRELQDRELPPEVVVEINLQIARLNAVEDNHLKLFFYFKLVKKKVLKLLFDDLSLVPKNYYRNLWLGLGIALFGIPLGIIFSIILNNSAFIAFGLPIGLIIGIAIGLERDRRAINSNKQLELEIN